MRTRTTKTDGDEPANGALGHHWALRADVPNRGCRVFRTPSTRHFNEE